MTEMNEDSRMPEMKIKASDLKQRSFRKRMQGYFFTGLLVLIPAVLSVFIIYRLFLFVDGLLNEAITAFIAETFDIPWVEQQIPGLGFIAVLLLILVAGMVARNYVGRKFINLGNKIVARIPVLNRIYSAIQQILEAIISEKSEVFKKAVLIEYPRKGIYSIAFVTQDTRGLIQNEIKSDVVSVFLPTTPNPTSGFLLFVPKKDTKELNMSIEEALKLIISGGAITPRPGKIEAQNSGKKFGGEEHLHKETEKSIN